MSIKDKKDTENKKNINADPHTDIKTPDCITPGIPVRLNTRTHGKGLWGGNRIVATFRCDEDIWKRFKQFSRLYYGSTCKVMESILVALMEPSIIGVRTVEEEGYTPGNTLDEPVPILNVENLHIHRNLARSRRDVSSSDWVAINRAHIDEVKRLVYAWHEKRYPCYFNTGEFWQAHKAEARELSFVRQAFKEIRRDDPKSWKWLVN